MDAVQKANSGHPGTPMGAGAGRLYAVDAIPALRSRRARLAQPRPLRALGRPCLDAALFAAAPRRRRGDRRRRQARPASQRSASTTSSSSASSARRRPAIPNIATPPASRRPPARSARAAAIRSAWRSPSAGWPRATTSHGFDAVRPRRLRPVRRRRHDGGRLRRGRVASPGTSSSSNLCWIYDSNQISIEGATDLAFDEDVGKRFEAYGWNVIHVDDANDCEAVAAGARGVQGDRRPADLHPGPFDHRLGQPARRQRKGAWRAAGRGECPATKQAYGWPEDAQFLVPDGVAERFKDGDRRARPAAARGMGADVRQLSRSASADLGQRARSHRSRTSCPTAGTPDIPTFAGRRQRASPRATPAARCSTRSRPGCPG